MILNQSVIHFQSWYHTIQYGSGSVMDNSDCSIQRYALVLPADGSPVRLMPYSIKERSAENGSVDFYDYLPDLRPWLEPAFLERDLIDFHVDNTSSKEWLRCEYTNTWGILSELYHLFQASTQPGLQRCH